MTLSVVIPAYNEVNRLPATLASIAQFFGANQRALTLHEVIVVDDGSSDGTAQVATSWSDRLPMQVRILPKNCGKGAAVREGVLHATGELVLLYDADGATPIDAVLRLWEAMKTTSAPIAIGSRVDDSTRVSMRAHRRFIGRTYHALCAGLHPGIRDAACGCKLFRQAIARELFARQRIQRFAFDIEILAMAHVRGYTIVEVPVDWTAVEKSKVRIVRDGLQMFWCVLALYARRFTGRL